MDDSSYQGSNCAQPLLALRLEVRVRRDVSENRGNNDKYNYSCRIYIV